MPFPKKFSVQQKITAIIFLASLLVLIQTSLQFVLFELKHKQDVIRNDIVSLSRLVSANARFPMAISDYAGAKDILDSLAARQDVVSAYLLLPNGQSIVGYSATEISHARIDATKQMQTLQNESRQIAEGVQAGTERIWQEKGHVAYFMPITFEGSHVGYSYISLELADLRKFQLSLTLGWFLAMGAALVITYLLSKRMQKHISGPIELLASRMAKISHEKRLIGFTPEKTEDEFSLLFRGFDEMIVALQERDRMLERHRRNLEQEVQKRTRDLAMEKEKAEQATVAKSRFLANMSHEIRTPMIGVLGMAELLRRKKLDEQSRQMVETIYRSGDALLTILNDILDFSKVEAGRLQIDAVAVDLERLITDVAKVMEVNAREKGVDILLEIPDGLPLVQGDPVRIRQILLNLVGNAVKFTEVGSVRVALSLKRTSVESCDCLFVIEDTGIGIPQESVARIFDSFDQGDSSMTRKYGGTGLGLPIARDLVQLMGGEMSVESSPGKGSTFSIRLPLPLAESPGLAPTTGVTDRQTPSTATAVPTGTPRTPVAGRVLLAEDNPTTQNLISILLQQMGIELTIVDNGQAVLDFLDEKQVDLILMDCQMPVLDGFETTLRLRDEGVSTPIVALTAHARVEDEQQCLDVGMNDYLSKPFRQAELREILVKWLGSKLPANMPVKHSRP